MVRVDGPGRLSGEVVPQGCGAIMAEARMMRQALA
jgi:hypothetical protein